VTAFSVSIRVYYEDTDAGGVVYYANYLRFLERARTEFMRALGYDLGALARDPGILFVVAGVEVDYRRPARHDDLLEVSVAVAERGRAGMTFAQQVRRGAELLVEAKVRVACVDAASFRPTALPDAIAQRLMEGSMKGSEHGAQR
jgi:acyl-CoA thioester hydrolase